MSAGPRYPVDPMWLLVLRDFAVDPAAVARAAGLPDDILRRRDTRLTGREYLQLWRGLDAVMADPAYPLAMAGTVPVEGFDAPLFAALCSPDLNTALQRLSLFKQLICPMRMVVTVAARTGFALHADSEQAILPASLVLAELVFVVRLARLATRHEVRPASVRLPFEPPAVHRFAAFFGITPERGPVPALTFHAGDARRPFLTANESMWRFFEPELRRRLATLEQTAAFAERVTAALLELLPSGCGSMVQVASRLGVSSRTLQRRLREEGTSFQVEVARTRDKLARQYLRDSDLSSKQIAYLLGYGDPNSFIRAFHASTGTTPERFRQSV